MSTYTNRDSGPILVQRWPSEEPLLIVAILVSIMAWIVIVVTVVGLVYAVFFAVFFGLMHLTLISHVRGSAVRLGPNQFPELHESVERLARRMGMDRVPEAYLMQAG